jgi:hypothetical protein
VFVVCMQIRRLCRWMEHTRMFRNESRRSESDEDVLSCIMYRVELVGGGRE